MILRLISILIIQSSLFVMLSAETVDSDNIRNNAFNENERLMFLIRWGVIRGGFATLEVDSRKKHNNRDCFLILSRVRSNGFFDTFYKVRDVNTSLIDADNFCVYEFEKHQREGSFSRDRKVEFLYDKNKILIHKGTEIEEQPLDRDFLQDVLSALYYLRTKDISLETKHEIEVFDGKKKWMLEVDVLKRETVQVPAGNFKCFKLKPKLKGEGIFKSKGDLYVWVTTDSMHLPVKLRAKIPVGSITGELITTHVDEVNKFFTKDDFYKY
ncbi:MAG: DUF3108 domain-containing protein [bacterium]